MTIEPSHTPTSAAHSEALSLDDLSHGRARAENVLLLEDLTWEHFWLDEASDSAATNRENDRDLETAVDLMGGLRGARVLELGAYEGYFSRQLERHGAAEVVAIEGNPRNFLKCTAIKNLFGLDRTRFLLGNCERYLDEIDERFDFVLATGILYHLFDPLAALRRIVTMTDHVFICTTYWHPELQGFRFTGESRAETVAGMAEPFMLYERANTQMALGKKHGMADTAWMFDYDSLLGFFAGIGWKTEVFRTIETAEPLKVRTRLLASRTALD